MIKRTGLFLALTMLVVGSLGFAQTAIPETPGANVGGTLTIASGQTFKDLDPRISNSVYDFYPESVERVACCLFAAHLRRLITRIRAIYQKNLLAHTPNHGNENAI